MSENPTPEEYQNWVSFKRREWHERRADTAERDVPEGRIGNLVIQLRRRARVSDNRARWILAALLITVLSGLFYYVGAPLWDQLLDGQRQTYEKQIADADIRSRELNEERAGLVSILSAALPIVGNPETIAAEDILGVVTLDGGKVMIAYGAGGQIMRSLDQGVTWNKRLLSDRKTINQIISVNNGSLLVGAANAGKIIVSYDRGETWVSNEVLDLSVDRKDNFLGVIALNRGEVLIGFGENGTITRSENRGVSWMTDKGDDLPTLHGMIYLADDDVLIGYGEVGTIIRSNDKGKSWGPNLNHETDDINGMLVLDGGNILVGFGYYGTIVRSLNKGEDWETSENFDGTTLNGMLAIDQGNILLGYGEIGTIIRSPDFGATWGADVNRYAEDLNDMISVDAGALLVAVGEGGAVLQSTNLGEDWNLVTTGSETMLHTVLTLGSKDSIMAFGNAGVKVAFSNNNERQFNALDLNNGSLSAALKTDQELKNFLNGIDGLDLDTRGEIEAQFGQLIARREGIIEDRKEAEDNIRSIIAGTYSLELIRVAFQGFMRSCTIVENPDSETIAACTAAWTAQQELLQDTWWKTLAERTPPGVLVLFLLATLGGLYRYNLRMAGFYHSRADALELLSLNLAKTAVDALAVYSDSLAADKVEFKASKTPADQATEIAKAAATARPR